MSSASTSSGGMTNLPSASNPSYASNNSNPRVSNGGGVSSVSSNVPNVGGGGGGSTTHSSDNRAGSGAPDFHHPAPAREAQRLSSGSPPDNLGNPGAVFDSAGSGHHVGQGEGASGLGNRTSLPRSDGSATTAPPLPATIPVLDKDRFEPGPRGELGEGGYGQVVHMLLKPEPGAPRAAPILDVAVKKVKDEGDFKVLLNEIKVVSALGAHENVIHFIGVVKAAGTFWIVMPLAPGGNLRTHLKGAATDFRLVARRALQLFLAIRHVRYGREGHRVFHRDIKPENLLVFYDDKGCEQLKLADFGLARDSDNTRANTKCRAGTREYMAPEQLKGGELGEYTDVYGCGATLWHMVTGKSPTGVRERQGAELETVQQLNPQCPPFLVDLIAQCCRNDPTQRPRMDDVILHLRRFLRGDEQYTDVGSVVAQAVGTFDVGRLEAALRSYDKLDDHVLADCIPTSNEMLDRLRRLLDGDGDGAYPQADIEHAVNLSRRFLRHRSPGEYDTSLASALVVTRMLGMDTEVADGLVNQLHLLRYSCGLLEKVTFMSHGASAFGDRMTRSVVTIITQALLFLGFKTQLLSSATTTPQWLADVTDGMPQELQARFRCGAATSFDVDEDDEDCEGYCVVANDEAVFTAWAADHANDVFVSGVFLVLPPPPPASFRGRREHPDPIAFRGQPIPITTYFPSTQQRAAP